MRRLPAYVLFLAGPVIWFAHFMVVYLFAEAACNPAVPGISPSAVVVFTVVATVVAAAATVALTIRAVRNLRADINGNWHLMNWGGAILGGLFVLAILLVGAPALVFPC